MPVLDIAIVDAKNMRELRRQVREKCMFEISANPLSARNFKLREMVRSPRKNDESDVVDALSDITDEILQRNDVEAVIIWAGTHLTDPYIAKLRAAYNSLSDKPDDAAALSAALFAVMDENTKRLLNHPHKIQQALDQERIHAEVAAQAETKLQRMVGQVRVFRPHDASFIRFPGSLVKPGWNTYQADRNAPLVSPALGPGNKILLTIGHGSQQGQTCFPSRGLLHPTEIAKFLGIASPVGGRILYIPLQCYPQQAVQAWQKLDGVAESIDQLAESDDAEMMSWINSDLAETVAYWVERYVIPDAAPNAITRIAPNPLLDGDDQDALGDDPDDDDDDLGYDSGDQSGDETGVKSGDEKDSGGED